MLISRAAIGLVLLSMTLCCSSCGIAEIASPDPLVKHPDDPMLILQATGTARVAVDTALGLQEFGVVDLEHLAGWTLVKFDWSQIDDGGRP